MASGRALSVYVLEVVLIKSNQIPMDVKKKCIELQKQGMMVKDIYTTYYSKHYDTKFAGFKSMFNRWKRKYQADEKHIEGGNLQYQFKPHATTVQVDSEGKVVQSWIKSKTDDAVYMELIDTIKDMQPFEYKPIVIEQAQDYMLEIPLLDMHFGIADYFYYMKTLREITRIIDSRVFKEINIVIGQDLFHNDDFKGRTSSGKEIQKVDMVKAWTDARQFYYQMIEKALRHTDSLKVIYSKGNHDEALSWAFVQMIKAQYGDQIKVDDKFKERKLMTFGSNFIGITHGDKIKSKPIDLRSIYTIEYPLEFAQSQVREIHAGHLHHEKGEDVYGIMCRSLSTGNPKDDWHDDNGFVGAIKRFMVFEWSNEKLASIHFI